MDTHAIIHRAYHALPDFRNKEGFPTGALYGVITMILKIVDDFNPDYVVAAYDLPGKTFRHEAYDDYKGGRKASDDELVEQIKRSRDVISAFNIPIYEAAGFEADDILGTIIEQTKANKDLDIIIASGDMDTLQLVDGKRVQVFTLKRGINETTIYDEQAVQERFGFSSDLIPDYKGLKGDPSDNIPGIKGIGDKGATQLITNFGSLEDIYKALKNPTKLEEAGVSKRTITLLKEGEDDAEFSKVLATIRRDAPITFILPMKRWAEGLNFSKIEAITTEFDFRSLWIRAKNLFDFDQMDKDPEVAVEEVSSTDIERVGLALWLINSDLTQPEIDDILNYSGQKTFAAAEAKIMAELKEKHLDGVYEQIELPIVPLVHAMEDKGVLLDLEYLKKLSIEYHTELQGYQNNIYTMAGREFNINSPKQMSEVLFDEMGLSTKGLKKTASGARSTRESELEKLRDEHRIIDQILCYRELQKLLTTYIDNLPDMTDDENRLHTQLMQAGTSTGRFSSKNPNLQNIPIRTKHGLRVRNAFIAPPGYRLLACDYSQIELRVAAIMSGDPYLIDIFVSGQDIHTAVAAKVFEVPMDKVTREMRSRAKTINFGILYGMGVNALQKNLQSTRAEAQEFYNKYHQQFSVLSQYLEDTKTFATKHGYTETLFGRRRYFPALKSKLPFVRATAERMAINAPIQGTATADIIKLAIKHVDQALTKAGLQDKVFPLLQVHDELLFEVKNGSEKEAVSVIVAAMEGVLENSFINFKTDVPLKVSAGLAANWGEVK